MPELPEVETVRVGLEKFVLGQLVKDVTVRRSSIVRGDISSLVGQTFVKARRFSKLLVLDTDKDVSLAIHLKMTGRLVYDNRKEVISEKQEAMPEGWEYDYATNPHTHLIFSFTSGSHLYFNDYRRFGTVDVLPTVQIPDLRYIKTLGKEFFAGLTSEHFYSALQSTGRAIKTVLLDQAKVSGVGNIYANESLWRSKLHPEIPANKLSRKQANILFKNLEEVMTEAKTRGGASSDNFRDLFGRKGNAQNYFDVYNQEGTPCKRCGTTLQKYFVGGRGTYICPMCQKSL
jgi:formamidopyrimidine-DNA glycosylase